MMLLCAFVPSFGQQKRITGFIDWNSYIEESTKVSADLLRRNLAIECPVDGIYDKEQKRLVSKVPDFPNWHIVSKSYCKSFAGGKGCEDFEKCWGEKI